MVMRSVILGSIAAALVLAPAADATTKKKKKHHVAVPSLVNVDLRNVLNNLAVRLHVDKANIPVNAQIPITIAANVCGVSVNVLAVSAANGIGHCSAKTDSPQLAQTVQQQMAAGGNVGGGAQGGSTASNTPH